MNRTIASGANAVKRSFAVDHCGTRPDGSARDAAPLSVVELLREVRATLAGLRAR